jgi:hypothetical protein
MSEDIDVGPVLLLTVLKMATVLLGLVIIYLSVKAYRGTRRRSILLLGIGMALMTLSAISEGLAFNGLGWTLGQSHVLTAVVTLAAFAALVSSLYA